MTVDDDFAAHNECVVLREAVEESVAVERSVDNDFVACLEQKSLENGVGAVGY